MIDQLNIYGLDKVQVAIGRIQQIKPRGGSWYLAFSGGKDSVTIKALADMAGATYDAHYMVSSVDPPELVRFIKTEYPEVELEFPRYADGTVATMWNLIPKQTMPPTQLARYCCRYLKEKGGEGRDKITGVQVRTCEQVRSPGADIGREDHGGNKMKLYEAKGDRVCCNCRHRVKIDRCEIDGHYIGYVAVFITWCRHWAKRKEGEL